MGDDEKKLKEDPNISGGMGGGMYYCPNCGMDGLQGANFCPNCGIDLSSASQRGNYNNSGMNNSNRGFNNNQQSSKNNNQGGYNQKSSYYYGNGNGGYSDVY